ncbi:annetocin receptor-like isoform X2 [Tachypleus tridentatus]|uniref:annetocin receptor-like isoform X2 n=1 Tax=Tachypleus tridentatus TaxID=6853 RepID=UPI003FD06580
MGEEIDRNSSSKTNQNNSFVIDARDHGELPMLEITVQIIIMLLGILGNGFILGAIARRRKVWPLSRVHICMFHLCLADLFVIIFNILPHVMRKVLLNFQGSDFFCRCVKFAEIFTLYLSVYILVSIAIDRFLAFQTSKGWNALKIIKVLNGVTWMISGLFAAPQTIFFLLTEVYPGRFDCRASFTVTWGITTYVIFFAVTLFGFPLMVIFVCYVKICKDIRNHYSSDITFLRKPSRRRSDFSERSFHLDAKDKHNRLNNGDDKFKRRERQVVNKRRSQLTYAKVKSVKLTLVIIISFFVCWVPFCTVQVLKLYNTVRMINSDVENKCTLTESHY